MAGPEPKEIVLASLSRCAGKEGFISSFYLRFMAASPDIPPYFRKTDFEKQNKMLLRSLMLSVGAMNGDSVSLKELGERAKSHDREHLNVHPTLYPFWLDALAQTVRQYDDKWTPLIDEAWRKTFQHVIDYMSRRY
ncbi:MAG: hypothetical protein CMJ46_13950 [Planctomyces sp.]|nr:hypothetical protein [Planctomyces sp.]